MRRVLHLLLAALCTGTGLFGASSPPASDPESEPAVALPPMIVSEGSGNRPWRYAATPAIEVLARCDDDITTDMIERSHRLTELLRLILPDELQFRTTVPRITILVDSAIVPALSRSLVEHTEAARSVARAEAMGDARAVADAAAKPPGIRMVPNLELIDADTMVTFTIVTPRTFRAEGIVFASDHLRMLVQQRTPPLPAWFVRGYVRLFPQLQFGSTTLTVPPLVWRSEPESRAFHEDPDSPRAVLPAKDFFAVDADGEADPAWVDQAELFVRWCLETPERRAALWRFAATSSGGWESALRDSFGLGASEWRDRLSDYLPVAVEHAIELRLEHPAAPPRVRVRDASIAEVGRIRGEWDRLAARFVRLRQPQYAAAYIELARKSLVAAQERAGNDPGLFAARGLFELEFGDRAAARPLLEAAAAGQKARPRVYVELAAMRLTDALIVDPSHVAISPGQAEIVFDELRRAQEQQPPIALADALAAETWVRAGVVPNQEQQRRLAAALERFPQNPALLWSAAVLYARSGQLERTSALIERGIHISRTDSVRKRFEHLRTTLLPTRTGETPAPPRASRVVPPSGLVSPAE